MAYKTHDAVKRKLHDNFESVVNGYLLELCNMWELDGKKGFFVGDSVGDVWCHGETLFINFDDIRYVVENDVSYSTYMDWMDYCVWAADFNQTIPNLKSWCNGCPRVDVVTQEKLSAMRYELEKAINETKEKF